MSIHKSIAKSATIIGFATFCSRVLGLVRDMVIAGLFGVYVYADAFVVAFRIPNLFRDLLGEGAANAAIVPVFSEYSVKHSKEEFWELANVVLNLLLVVVTAITLLGIVFAPVIVRIFAPGFASDPQKLAITVALNRIIFPYCLLICLAAYATAILNSLKHFSVPAFAPCLLNISIIVFALIFGEGITGLAAGVLIGGALQLLIQMPVLYKKGFRLDLFRRFRHPAANMIAKLMMPRVLSSGIYQLNNVVDSAFGSLAFVVGQGGVAVLYYAYRLIQFPLGIFSNSLFQAILPTFSTQALEKNFDKLKHTLSFGLRSIFFLMVPSSIGLIVLSGPVIRIIYERGKFDAYSAAATSNALLFYAIGLSAYAAIKVLQACFFALKDTVTPTKISGLALVLNIVLNTALIFPLKISGIALATSLSGIISCLALFFILDKKLSSINHKEILSSFWRIFLAGLAMGGVCILVNKYMPAGAGVAQKIVYLAVLIFVSVASYAGFCFVFGVREMRELWKWVRERKS